MGINTPSVYSFLDVSCTINGPGGNFSLGAGSGNAEEGISVEFTEDADNLKIGADGSPMHSLNPSKAGKVMIRLLKTSPVNAQLTQLYVYQHSSGLYWAQNVLTVINPVTGDDYTCSSVAFTKFPRNDYPKEATFLEWDFTAGYIDPVLGAGLVALANLP